MIKLEKTAVHYLKNTYHHTSTIEKRTFQDEKQALFIFENTTPKHYINNKDFSIVENISLYIPTENGVKSYYKTIDPITEEEKTNYKKEA